MTENDPSAARFSDDVLRMAALARTGLLDTPREPQFDAICAAVKALLDVPIALVSLVDRDRQWFKAASGVDVRETPIGTSVCALAIRQTRLFVIHDLSTDPRTAAMSLVTGPEHLRFYAGFPIVTGDGVAIGSVCAIDTKPRLSGVLPHQAIGLEALARQASVEIERGSRGDDPHDPVVPFSVGSWDWDIAADRMTADARYARLLGADPARAAAGVTIAQFLEIVHRDDQDRVRAAIEDTVAGRAPYSCEYRIRRRDGSTRWVLAQGRLVRGLDGQPRHFPGAVFDIDARRRQELRLAALVELNDRLREAADPDAVAFTASEILGRTLDVARVGYGRIDAESETIEIGRNWMAKGAVQLPASLRLRDYGSFIDDLKVGRTVTISDIATDPRTADHADEIVAAFGVRSLVNLPIMEGGVLVAMLIVNDHVARDWTAEEQAFVEEIAQRTRHAVERRRTETELATLNRQLEAEVQARTAQLMIAEENLRQSAKMEAVGQLTGGLAHDFNNLLTGISGAIEMLRLRVSQGRVVDLDRYTGMVSEAVTRAAALTHRLLAFSRRQTLDPKPTDANALLDGIVEMIRRTVGPAHPVETRLDPALATILVDPNQLENAVLNLCINARDAMPDGGTITIVTRNERFDRASARERDLVPGDYVALCVTDTGIGMSEEVRSRAFDPFYTTKPLGSGTGLGLSMIYGFVRQSGGQVRIETVEGEGTTMCLYLPQHHGAAVAQPAREDGAFTEVAEQPRHTILVVDDEAAIRDLVVEAMRDLGHNVLQAGDGAQALAMIDAAGETIDLLVTDVGLPGAMNGRQVADAALARMPTLKIVFITGYAEQAVIGGRQLDANTALLTKPFALDTLSAKVCALLAA